MSDTLRVRALTALFAAVAVVATTFVISVASAPAANAANCYSTYLSYGSRGNCVKVLQRNLGGLGVDGVYGSNTRSRVRAFQADAGLGVDGKAGPQTWRKLRTYGKAVGWKSGVTVYLCEESSTRFRYAVWNNTGKRAAWELRVEGGHVFEKFVGKNRIVTQGRMHAGTYDSKRLTVWLDNFDNYKITTKVRDFSHRTLPNCA